MHNSKSSLHPETPNIVLNSIFQRYDADHDGLLNELEFGNALDDLGINDETEQRALFALADSNNSKTVQFDDFINLIKSNDFELILSSRKDYEFVIETYKAFEQYDQNGDGQITWDEFYFYLTKHGYSHQYISQYWYYIDIEQKLTVSFEEFWKGFKLQSNAIAQHQLQQQINKEIKTTPRSRVLNRPSLIDTHCWTPSDGDKQNVFQFMKSQLKPTKQNKSPHAATVGRVLDDDKSLKIYCNIKEFTPRLPDVIAMTQSPLHAILPSFKPNTDGLTINLLSPTVSPSPSLTPNYSWISTPNYSITSTPNYSLILTPNYSNYSTSFPSISPLSSSSNLSKFPSLHIEGNESEQSEYKKKRKRLYKKKRKGNKMKGVSDQYTIDRTPVLRPRKRSKCKKKHKVYQSAPVHHLIQ